MSGWRLLAVACFFYVFGASTVLVSVLVEGCQ